MSRHTALLITALVGVAAAPVQSQTLLVADDHYGIPFRRPLQVEVAGVLDNDTLDGSPAGENGATAILISGPGHGTLQCPSDSQLALCPDGSFDYIPDESFPGSDSFVYQAAAGAVTGSATVTLTACTGGPQIYACWHEASYLSLLTELGYASFTESFEGDAWNIARTPDVAANVVSQGVTWRTNHPASNGITTGSGAATSGLYGVFDPLHGAATGSPLQCDVDVPAESCLYHDGFAGSRVAGEGELHGIGGFITGTWGQKVSIILDGAVEIGFGNLPGYRPQFIGVVDAGLAGFSAYQFREMDGKVGQKELIWGDDFTFAIVPLAANTAPVADAGLPQAVLTGDTVVLDGSRSSDVDEDRLTYRWSFESLPAASNALLDTIDSVTPSFVADAVGIYRLRLIVNDTIVDSAPDTVEITAGCSGDLVVLSNTMVPVGITDCTATTSIILGPSVLVVDGAELLLNAPTIRIIEGVTVQSGAVLRAVSVP